MTDYIKREDAIKEVCDQCVFSKCYSACNSCKERHRIESIPAADVAEIVRCNDCFFFDNRNYDGGRCMMHDCRMGANDYCSFGDSVRKEKR